MGITAHHALAQPGPQHSDCFAQTIVKPCANADCEGMCLIGKDMSGFQVGYRCACPIGQRLVDGRRCVPATDYLLFSSNKVVRGIYPDIVQPALADAILPISPISQRRIGMYLAVECDVGHGAFFYADAVENVVYRLVFSFCDHHSFNMLQCEARWRRRGADSRHTQRRSSCYELRLAQQPAFLFGQHPQRARSGQSV